MDPYKKRVSFSHIALPKHFRTISSDTSTSTDRTSSDFDSVELHPGGTPVFSVTNPSSPPTFKAVESFHIALRPTKSASPEINNNNKNQSENSTSVSSFKFQETRRRSHAFSVSAIDETLSVNMNGEEYTEDYGSARRGSDSFESVEDGHFSSSAPKKNGNRDGVFRAAEIPLDSRNRVLLCLTTNEIINNKSFQHEVRALKDLDWFLSRPNVLLDCDCSSVEVIIDSMLEVFEKALPVEVLNEARAQIYAANNAAFHLSNVIQNVHLTEDGQYLHDPSWLCT